MRRVTVLTVTVVAAAALGAWWLLRQPAETDVRAIPGEGERITVEVLNGTDVDGLARATTQHLRAGGIDVVYFGTAATDTFSVTRILVRRGDTTAAARVQEVLGLGTLVVDEDPLLLLDVSVYVGRDVAVRLGLDP